MQDFPKMIYHVVEEPIIVQTEEGLQEMLEAGWSESPVVFSEAKALDAKIAELETRLKDLKKKRLALRPAKPEVKEGKAA